MPDLERRHAVLHAGGAAGLSVTEAAPEANDQPHHQDLARGGSVTARRPRQTATDPAPLEMFETVINLKFQATSGGRA